MNWALFAITISISGLIIPLFIAAGRAVKPEVKEKVGRWLINDLSSNRSTRIWAESFIKLFDDVFGEETLSRKRIFRSIMCSLLLSLFFSAIQLFVNNIIVPENFIYEDKLLGNFVAAFFYISVFNLIGDYLSLAESRFVLGYLTTAKWWMIFLILVVDILFTWICFWIPFYIVILFAGNVFRDMRIMFETRIYYLIWPLLITSFLTSLWLYIFLFGAEFIKFRNRIIKGKNQIFGFFDAQNKPFTSLAVVSSTFIFILGLVLSLIF